MQRPIITTKEVTVPSGYKVILKAKKMYGDKLTIEENALGALKLNTDGMTDMTLAQAMFISLETIKVMVVGWDATDENDLPIPIDGTSIKETFTDADVNFLMGEIEGKATLDPK